MRLFLSLGHLSKFVQTKYDDSPQNNVSNRTPDCKQRLEFYRPTCHVEAASAAHAVVLSCEHSAGGLDRPDCWT